MDKLGTALAELKEGQRIRVTFKDGTSIDTLTMAIVNFLPNLMVPVSEIDKVRGMAITPFTGHGEVALTFELLRPRFDHKKFRQVLGDTVKCFEVLSAA